MHSRGSENRVLLGSPYGAAKHVMHMLQVRQHSFQQTFSVFVQHSERMLCVKLVFFCLLLPL